MFLDAQLIFMEPHISIKYLSNSANSLIYINFLLDIIPWRNIYSPRMQRYSVKLRKIGTVYLKVWDYEKQSFLRIFVTGNLPVRL